MIPVVPEKSESRRGRRRWLGRAIGLCLLAAAVATELRRPPDQRTWEGRIAGLVPYDLRRPTLARFRERWWNPQDPHILVPAPLGIGWTVNLGRLLRPRRERQPWA